MMLLHSSIDPELLFFSILFYLFLGVVVVSALITALGYLFHLFTSSTTQEDSFDIVSTFQMTFYVLGGFVLVVFLFVSLSSLFTE